MFPVSVFDPPVLPLGREITKKGGAIAKSYQDLVSEAMAETEQTDVQSVHDFLESGEDLTVLDVREPGEWEEAHIPQVKHLPRDLLEYQADEQLPNKTPVSSSTAPPGAGAPSRRSPSRRWATRTSPTWRAA